MVKEFYPENRKYYVMDEHGEDEEDDEDVVLRPPHGKHISHT